MNCVFYVSCLAGNDKSKKVFIGRTLYFLKFQPFDCCFPCFLSASFSCVVQICIQMYQSRHCCFYTYFVLLKQAETKVMNNWSIFDSKTLFSFSQKLQSQASHSLSSQFPVGGSRDAIFKFYNKDYDPFIDIRRLNVQSYLKNSILKAFISSLVSMQAIFKACAVLSTNSEF